MKFKFDEKVNFRIGNKRFNGVVVTGEIDNSDNEFEMYDIFFKFDKNEKGILDTIQLHGSRLKKGWIKE